MATSSRCTRRSRARPAADVGRHTSRGAAVFSRTGTTCALLALATLGAFAATPAAARAQANPDTGWHVVKRIPVGGEGFWDYLATDPTAHRLYVSHGTHVVVVDMQTDQVVGDLPNTPGVHGIALAPALGRGFTSNGRDSTVTIFDLRTLKELGRVNVGAGNPDAILFDPSTRRVFTMNGRSDDATAIDAATGKVVGHVDLGGRPEFGVADGHGHVYVNIESKSEVAEVDPRALTVVKRWSILPCEGPSGLATDVAHNRLFSVCDKVMAVSDPAAGKVVATVAIGEGPDAARFDPGLQLAFASCGQGVLSVVREVSPDRYELVENAPTQRGARTMELDPRTHRIYLSTAEFGPAPAPTAERPHPRPTVVPGSFTVLVVER